MAQTEGAAGTSDTSDTSETLSVRSGDIRLAVHVSGPCDAPPIVLVHGYPDSSHIWDAVRSLLEPKFRVIAYDVRGAGASDAPAGQAGYRLEHLAADLAAVAEATCSGRPFHLVGHDWGSVQSWQAVTSEAFRGRIASFTSISGPCLDHMAVALREGRTWNSPRAWLRSLRQAFRSSYIFFFHLPMLPELVWRSLLAPTWRLRLRATEGIDAPPDPALLRNAINGLGLYRANFVERMRNPIAGAAIAPVQFIVPMRDRYVGAHLCADLERWLGSPERVELDAPHWVVLSHASSVARAVERFVERHEPCTVNRADRSELSRRASRVFM